MSETRVAVAKLLCKIFLHYLVTLAEWDGMLETWYKILELMERLMGCGQGQGMVRNNTTTPFPLLPIAPSLRIAILILIQTQEEEISESLKNILYFMKSDGYLVAPSSSASEKDKDAGGIWHETWKRVDRFLPGMRKEIFSESPPQSKARPRRSAEDEIEKERERIIEKEGNRPPPASVEDEQEHDT